jgi:hypothetical protein
MASGVLALVLIVVAALLPGRLIVRQFAGAARPTLLLAFAALTLGVAALGWAALVLAELGRFSLVTLAVTWLVLVAALAALDLWRRRSGRFPAAVAAALPGPALFPALPGWVEALFLAAWLVAALWLFFRPHETVTGAADAGVYVNLAASIDREGGILIQDETLAGLDPALYDGLLRPQPDNPVAPHYLVPGFYVIGQPRGEITPQFYPLHPVWQAVAYGLAAAPERLTAGDNAAGIAAGANAALLLTGLWTTLGSLAIYLLVRLYAGWETAALALLGLSLTAVQVWFARYPTTEMLTQYLLWTGLLALALWLSGEGPSRLWALLAGVSLGQVFLVRVDMLVLLPVIGLMVVVLALTGRRLLPDRLSLVWFVVPFTLLVAHSFIHAWWQSRPYFVVHSGLGLRLLQVNWAIPLVAAAAGGLGLWLLWRYGAALGDRATGPARRYALLALIGVTVAFVVYGWFVRPVVGQTILRPDAYSGETIPLTDYQNWPRLGWYLSPLGLALGVAGICVLIWRMDRRVALMLAVGGLFSVLYLWNLRANPHHIYAMRRYVPVVLPFFIVGGATFIGWLARRRGRVWSVAAGLLALLWLGGLGWSARGFVSQVDYAGLTDQLVAFNETLTPRSVLLFNDSAPIGQGDFFGTPLKFLFGHDVFTVRDLSAVADQDLVAAIDFWQNSGRAVYWFGDPTWPQAQGFRADGNQVTLSSRHLEQSYLTKPQAVLNDEWVLSYASLER